MKLFDLHCDTPYRIYSEKLSLSDRKLDVCSKHFGDFDEFVQCGAIWSDYKKSGEENYSDFFKIYDKLLSELKENNISLCTTRQDFLENNKNPKMILCVEGASLLCGNLTRIEVLYSHGVRIITPLWRDENEIGGAFNTERGLSLFGRALVSECEKMGVLVDVSHMSEKSFWDTASISQKPILATHSNSKSVCNHLRNLTDNQFRTIQTLGGIVGINFYPPHLSSLFSSENHVPNVTKYLDAIYANIMHFLELGGEKTVSLGADRDGFDSISGYSSIEFVNLLYEELLKRKINEKIIKDIFFGNALRFFSNNLPIKKGI